MKNYQYTLELKVRDYECDIQGIVNNAVYQNYLEHTRHEFIKTLGHDFTKLHNEGIDMVVARLDMSFKKPLASGDSFLSCLNFYKEGIKYMFEQDIYRMPDLQLSILASVTAVALVNGKLSNVEKIDELIPPRP